MDLTVRDIYARGNLQPKSETSMPGTHEVTESFRANMSAMRDFFIERIDSSKLGWEWSLYLLDMTTDVLQLNSKIGRI